jgi:hypothetical protein
VVLENLADRVNDLLRDNPAMPWDEAVRQIAHESEPPAGED